MDIVDRFPEFEEFPALGEALNRMADRINSLTPRGARGVKIRHSPTGFTIEADPESEISSNGAFRGEYDQTLAYSPGDEFLVSVGPEAGHYLTIQACPANPTGDAQYFPWAGRGYFVLTGRLNDQSSWL
jgi:hypothetical protein